MCTSDTLTLHYLVKISRKAVSTPPDAQDHHFLLLRFGRHPSQEVLGDIAFAPAKHRITPMGVTASKPLLPCTGSGFRIANALHNKCQMYPDTRDISSSII